MTTFHADAPHKPFPDVDSLAAWQARQGSRQVQASTAPASPPATGRSRLDAALDADAAYVKSLTKAGPPPGAATATRRNDGGAIGGGAGPKGTQGSPLQEEYSGAPPGAAAAALSRLQRAFAARDRELHYQTIAGPPLGSHTKDGVVRLPATA